MTKYITSLGEFEAETPEDLVEFLRAGEFEPSGSAQEFMEEMADRVVVQAGARPSTASAEEFVEALLQLGLVKEA